MYGYVGNNPVNYTDSTGLVAGVDDAALITLCATNPIACGAGAASILCITNPSACQKVVQGCFDTITGMFNQGDKDPSTPTGRRGSPSDVPKGTNAPTTIGDRDYSGHALDQMQGRGVPPSVVEDTIQNGAQSPDPIPGRTRNYSPDSNVTVITDSNGTVITVINGKR